MVDPSPRLARAAAVRPADSRRAFEEILDRLEEAIASGELGPGDRLPSERDLAARFGVSRPSVREALRVLEALGLVSVRRGAEHGVTLREEPQNAFAHLFRFHLALDHTSVASLVEFRVAIESWAAGLVAARGGAETLAELDRQLDAMRQPGLGQVGFHSLDAAFHLELVRGAGNELATSVLEASRTAIQRTMLAALVAKADWPSTRDRLVREHAAVVEAIRAGDGAAASRLVTEHVTTFWREHLG